MYHCDLPSPWGLTTYWERYVAGSGVVHDHGGMGWGSVQEVMGHRQAGGGCDTTAAPLQASEPWLLESQTLQVPAAGG